MAWERQVPDTMAQQHSDPHAGPTARRPFVTLDDVADGASQAPNSPRSVEVCLACGIPPSELIPRSAASFAEYKGERHEIVKMRADRYELRRKEKLAFLQQERAKHAELLAAARSGAESSPPAPRHSDASPGGASGVSGAMSATYIEREVHQLDTRLRREQLRLQQQQQHRALEESAQQRRAENLELARARHHSILQQREAERRAEDDRRARARVERQAAAAQQQLRKEEDLRMKRELLLRRDEERSRKQQQQGSDDAGSRQATRLARQDRQADIAAKRLEAQRTVQLHREQRLEEKERKAYEFEKQRLQEQQERMQHQEQRSEMQAVVQSRQQARLQEREATARDKQTLGEQRENELQLRTADTVNQRNTVIAERHAHAVEVARRGQAQKQSQMQVAVAKMQEKEARVSGAVRTLQDETQWSQAEKKLKQQDAKECVERRKRITEYEQQRKQAKLDDKMQAFRLREEEKCRALSERRQQLDALRREAVGHASAPRGRTSGASPARLSATPGTPGRSPAARARSAGTSAGASHRLL